MFHDFFGHVPMLFNPVFADYMQAYGRGGLKAHALGASRCWRACTGTRWSSGSSTRRGLARLRRGHPLLGGEIRHCIDSPEPHRIGFDLPRMMRTRYKIDTFQENYFVIRGFGELFAATAPDFTPYYEALRPQELVAPSRLLPGDRVHSRGAARGHA